MDLSDIQALLATSSGKAEDVFDGDWYLEKNPDVANAGMDPWKHYRKFGATERRDPNGWFSNGWYREQYLTPIDLDIEPLQHFIEQGQGLGYVPSEELFQVLMAEAQALFDAEFYLHSNKDVAEAGVDPWQHYQNWGWKEGRDPSAAFSTAVYCNTHMADHPLQINPLLHFVQFQDGAASPAPGPVAEAILSEHQEHASELLRWIDETTDLGFDPAELDDIDLVVRSALFDEVFLAAQSDEFQGLDRRAAAELYLSKNALRVPNPSPLFSARFYTDNYGARMRSHKHPFVHYLRRGRGYGFYPSSRPAFRDILQIKTVSNPDRASYVANLNHVPRFADPVVDYVIEGQFGDTRIDHTVDAEFVRGAYPAFADARGTPVAFYYRHVDSCWVFASGEHLAFEVDQIRECPLFDAAFYARVAGIEETDIDPALHYAVVGTPLGLPCSPEFDTGLYLTKNPDIASSRVVPLLHFHKHGKGEGRVAAMVSKIIEGEDVGETYDPERPTVVVFSHEASRTGAPIVALNIARHLCKTHNVICWVGEGGALMPDFQEVSVRVLEGWSGSFDTEERTRELKEVFNAELAIVNSVVSNPVVSALRLANMPVVSLIHEFADYVYPQGTTSRMALTSDLTVFPAEVVQDACFRELAKFGAGALPGNTRIRPQGYNTGSTAPAPLTANDIYQQIGADPENPRTRILFGAGYVQPRKGVDLFLQTARELMDDPDHDWKFIWVGGNYLPEKDMVTSVYLAHQLREAGLSADMTFMPEQSSLEPFWEVADVFFLSSRLDPYPNVALDAIDRNVPVVCFEGATGIARLGDDYPFAVKAVPFANVTAAAHAASGFVGDWDAIQAGFDGPDGKKMSAALTFESYVSDLLDMGEEAKVNTAAVAEVQDQLATLDPGDLSEALNRLPKRFRLGPLRRPDLMRRGLAEHLLPGRLDLPLKLEGPGLLRGLSGYFQADPATGLVPWNADWGSLAGLPPAAAVSVALVLHVRDDDVLHRMRASCPPFDLLLSKLETHASGETASLLKHLGEALPETVKIAGKPAGQGILGLVRAAEATEADYLVFADLACDRSNVMRPTIPAPEAALFEAVASDAALQPLRDLETCQATFAALHLGDRSSDSEQLYAKIGDSSDLPVYAPRFSGVYSRKAVLDFARDHLPGCLNAGSALAPQDLGGFASMVFARELRKSGQALTLLPLDPNS